MLVGIIAECCDRMDVDMCIIVGSRKHRVLISASRVSSPTPLAGKTVSWDGGVEVSGLLLEIGCGEGGVAWGVILGGHRGL